MDALFIMALQLEGGPQYDAEGRIDGEQTERLQTYTRNKYIEICNEWEAKTGKTIQVIPIED